MQDIDDIIQANIKLVYAQLHKYNLANDPEAESIGYEALYHAIRDYDSSKGTKLSTVATVYIYNALGSYVRKLNNKRQLQIVSYNNIVQNGESDEDEFVDLIPADTCVESDYIRQENSERVREIFDKAYSGLTNEKHKLIIKCWNESDFTAQTKDIAAMAGVSQSYASQVILNFKSRLKKKLEDIYYD